MDELDKNIPDDLWRKVFDEASETPPLRVWDAIERQLDESNGPKILPLWGTGLASSRPVVWGMRVAAAVAMLLMGWWSITTFSVDKPEKTISAIHQAKEKEADVASTQKSASKDVADKKSDNSSLAPETESTRTSEHVTHPDVVASGMVASRSKSQRNERSVTTSEQNESITNRFRERTVARHQKPSGIAPFDKRTNAIADVSRPYATFSKVVAGDVLYAPVSAKEAMLIDEQAYATASISRLRNKSLRLGGVRPIQRIVWFRPAELPLESDNETRKHERREMWASVGMMSGTFNPMVSVQSSPAMAMVSNVPVKNTSAFKNTQPSINSRASFSVAYQAGAGVQLSEHWTIESGIGYLSGRSTVETPTQSSSFSNLAISNSNLFVDAIRTSTSNRANMDQQMVSSPSSNFTGQTVYNELSQQTLTNNYQFMQVPVQVGYQIRPRKRLSMSLLGGLLTNIFVKNTVGDNVVVTAQDGVYRPLSLAATMGARFRYRPSRQWSASVAGVYQPSLTAGTQAESQVQSHPTVMGMSFGVDYHF